MKNESKEIEDSSLLWVFGQEDFRLDVVTSYEDHIISH